MDQSTERFEVVGLRVWGLKQLIIIGVWDPKPEILNRVNRKPRRKLGLRHLRDLLHSRHVLDSGSANLVCLIMEACIVIVTIPFYFFILS